MSIRGQLQLVPVFQGVLASVLLVSAVASEHRAGAAVTDEQAPDDQQIEKRTRFVVMAGWGDVPHLTAEQIKQETAGIPPHEIEARSLGKPSLGSGAIYPVPESEFVIDPFVIPEWMRQAYGLDVGWKRTAAIWGALDVDTDILYLYSEHYRGMAEPPIHAAGIRSRGLWIPGVIDPAARGRGQKDGKRLMVEYTELGLNLTMADNALESGILKVWTRLSTGRLKVFKTLVNWMKEYRFYQRDEHGQVKDGQADHLMDASRYLVQSGLELACVRPPNMWTIGGQKGMHTSDYDPAADAYNRR